MSQKEFNSGLFISPHQKKESINRNESSFMEIEVEEKPERSYSVVEEKKTRSMEINGDVSQLDHNTNKPFKNNKIKTSKYSWWNFVFLNIALQFSKMANVYFLIVSILQCIPNITITNGQPTTLFPLAFVVIVSMIKDLYEDVKRSRSDREENQRQVLVANQETGEFEFRAWASVRVGQILKIKEGEFFPADLLLVNSSELKGMCYVETKNLDGETNLKHKMAPKELLEKTRTEEQLFALRGTLEYGVPDELLYVFEGKGSFQGEMPVALGYDNILLRGSSLRNCEYIYGVVVYSGHETKIMMNSPKSRSKSSQMEITTSRFVIIIMLIQLGICIFCALYNTIWFFSNYDDLNSYLDIDAISWYKNEGLVFVVQLFTWFLLFSNFVPISLIVTLEIVKFIQAAFIQWDIQMFDKERQLATKVQSSNLNEELGMVRYIFSDKTGTLTCNVMEFKKMSIGHEKYGKGEKEGTEEEKQRLAQMGDGITNCSFMDDRFFQHKNDRYHENQGYIRDYLMVLAVCHTVIVQQKEDRVEYNAASPDELALINAAKFFGCELKGRDEEGNVVLCWDSQIVKFTVLNVLEFTSTRKRMSVVVRSPNGTILLLTKGADSVIFNRLDPYNNPLREITEEHLEEFARIGLRTLVLGMREVPPLEYEEWNEKFQMAATSLIKREEKLGMVAELIEKDLRIVGTTAIEDKLQDKVAETISFIRDAGIKLWVLTGDKIETAINIGYSCKVLQRSTEIHIIDQKRSVEVIRQMSTAQAVINQRQEGESDDHAIIVSGDSLLKIMKQKRLKDMFLYTSSFCGVVIACRVSPKQKAEVVHLVKSFEKRATTLAIGDGANDVNMITSAHIGVGILGLEGAQAARASDYAIGQFKYLKRILFFHGRECYRRNALLICYGFYKNVVASLPQFWFGFPSAFSGQTSYDQWIFQFYNIFFTALPVMWFAIFDYEYNVYEFMTRPEHYDIGLRSKNRLILDKKFGKWNLWRWMFYALWHSLVLTMVGFYIFQTPDSSGKMADLFTQGSLTLLAVILVVTVKMIVENHLHSLWFWLICVLSVGSYFVIHWFLSNFNWSDLSGTYEYMFDVFKLYISLIWISFSIVLVDFTLHRMRLLLKVVIKKISKNKKKTSIRDKLSFDPHATESMLEEEILNESRQRKRERQKTLREQGYSGYAFSGEAGHAPQVTDSHFYEDVATQDYEKVRRETLPVVMEEDKS